MIPSLRLSHTLNKMFILKNTLCSYPGRKFRKLSCDVGALGSLHPRFSVDSKYLICLAHVENVCKHHVQNSKELETVRRITKSCLTLFF